MMTILACDNIRVMYILMSLNILFSTATQTDLVSMNGQLSLRQNMNIWYWKTSLKFQPNTILNAWISG